MKIIFADKIFSSQIKEIKKENGSHTLFKKKIYYVEFFGVVLESRERYLKVLDKDGIIEIYRDKSNKKLDGPHSFTCKLFGKNSDILLYCVNSKKISIYEQIFSWIEINELNKYRVKI